MRLIILISLLTLPFLFTACSSVKVYSDYDRSIDFSKYKTFAWLQRADSVNNYWYNNQIIEKNVVYYTSEEMKKRGFNLDLNNPDLLIEYHSTVQKKQYTVSNPIYSRPTYPYSPVGYNPFKPYAYNNTPYIVGYQQRQVEYNEETLLIDIIDRKTNQLIWRGWSEGSVNNEQDLEKQLPNDIKKIMLKFPIPIPTQKSNL